MVQDNYNTPEAGIAQPISNREEGRLVALTRPIEPKMPIRLVSVRQTPTGARLRRVPSTGNTLFGFDAGEPCTDLGNSERLIRYFGDRIAYSYKLGWLAYDGTRWTEAEGTVHDLAKRTARAILGEAESAETQERRAELARHAIRSESAKSLRAMIEVARSDPRITVKPEDLDRDPRLLNVLNGTIDLRTGELRPHDPKDRITKLAPVKFDPGAQAPAWEAFLRSTFAGNDNLVRFVGRAMGYSLTGETKEQVLFILYGSGSNGKSTMLEVVAALLGDYAQQTPVGTFLHKRSDAGSNDLAALKGARFVSTVEVDEGKHLSEALVKQMTGGDRVTARFLFREYFTYVPTFKIHLATNHRPLIRGTDRGMWRRIRLIPFTTTFYDTDDLNQQGQPKQPQKDATLKDKLLGELSGILNWAVAGCLDWQKHGLEPPVEVLSATDEYRVEQDVLAAFLSDRCVQAPGAKAYASELYEAYKEWSAKSGEHPVTQREFGMRLGERGFTSKRGTGGYHLWEGIGLLTSEFER